MIFGGRYFGAAAAPFVILSPFPIPGAAVIKTVMRIVGLLVVAAMFTGCGDGGPKLYQAGGTVKFKGQALPGARVTCLYDDGEAAIGMTDAQGKFGLTFNGRSGARPGKAKVTVQKKSGGAEAAAPTTGEMNPADMIKAMKDAQEKSQKSKDAGAAKDEIPAKYGDPEKSGLTVDIQPSNTGNDFLFDLQE